MALHDREGGGTAAPNGQLVEEVPLVHKVLVPPPGGIFKEVGQGIWETFFYDAPVDRFRGQSKRIKSWLGLKFLFPMLEWITSYKSRMFVGDLIAGITIASLAIPQDLGYSKLAGVPPVNGLWSSRDIAIGPVAVVSLLMGTLLKQEISPTEQPALYLQLAFTATFFAGIFQTGLGILRLGFVIQFLSHAAIVGFMAGAAVTIALQQLKGLLNITNFTTDTDFVSVMKSVFGHIDEWNWRSIVIGLAFLSFLVAAKVLAKKKPKLFWVSAIAPLTSVILATVFVFVFRADKRGVKVVGHIKQGVNPSSADQLLFTGKYVGAAAKIGLVTSLIALTEGVAIGRTFAALRDYHIDGNKEMIAFGIMNICGSLTSCYCATGSFSRSAVNYQAGVKTAMANVVMAITVLITLLFLTPLFKYTPNTILSAIIISAVLSLIDFKAAWIIWKIDKFDFLATLGAFFGVFFVSVEIGLLIAVCISFVKILFNVTRPHTALLGNIPGTNVYRNLQQYPKATVAPGIVAVRVDAAIYFSNSQYIHDKALRYVEDEMAKPGSTPIQYLIIDLTPVTNIDTSGIIAMEELQRILKKRKIQLAFANPGSQVIQKFDSSGLLEELGSEWIFFTVGEAVQVCSMFLNKAAGEGSV
uniref:STAS domain-containing protein n=1 Tax=Physcomitrium patens TaxID=3218 RepID=A0A7I4E5H9_PHYPA